MLANDNIISDPYNNMIRVILSFITDDKWIVEILAHFIYNMYYCYLENIVLCSINDIFPRFLDPSKLSFNKSHLTSHVLLYLIHVTSSFLRNHYFR